MFGKLMDSIDDDYLRYVMHVQVIEAPSEDPDYAQAAFVAADDPAAGLAEPSAAMTAELAGVSPQAPPALSGQATVAAATGASRPGTQRGPAQPAGGQSGAPRGGRPSKQGTPSHGQISPTGTRIVGGPPAKVGRNEPCWCGSGRKFKVCHGAS
jgi:preprotein translocase subunit SecA